MQSTENAPNPAPLPVHAVPYLPPAEAWQLVLQNGAQTLTLDVGAVAALSHVDLVDTLTCLEGWSAGPLHWHGIPLSALLDAVGGPAVGWIAVSAPDFRSVIPLDELPETAMLADALDGRPLPREHGGPLRLVVPGAVCYRSVKWVQCIELRDSPAGDTAQARALARLKAEQP